MIKFNVNGTSYEIEEQKLIEFPIQNSYLCLLYQKYKANKDNKINEYVLNVKTTNRDEIIVTCQYYNFDKILRLYENPNISVFDLFNFNDILETLDLKISKYESDNRERICEKLESNENFLFLSENNYNFFLEELAFYGVENLTQFCVFSEIEPDKFIHRIKRNICRYFNIDNVKCKEFLWRMKSLGGYISGSFILKSIYKHDWENNDIDIYFNVHQMIGMADQICKDIKTYKKSCESSEFRRMDYSKMCKYNHIDWENLIASVFSSVLIINPNQIEVIDMKRSYKGRNEDAEIDSGYGMCKELCKIIKLQMWGKKVDFCLLDCTPQYFISNFDFKFNEIYYDGHGINSFHWDSFMKKNSVNNYARDRFTSHIYKYLLNIKRIEKYFRRGFVITHISESEKRKEYEERIPSDWESSEEKSDTDKRCCVIVKEHNEDIQECAFFDIEDGIEDIEDCDIEEVM